MVAKSLTTAMPGARKDHLASGTKMPCECGGDLSRTVDTRRSVIGADSVPVIRRHRRCDRCGCRSTTLEVSETFIANLRAEILKDIAIQIIVGSIK